MVYSSTFTTFSPAYKADTIPLFESSIAIVSKAFFSNVFNAFKYASLFGFKFITSYLAIIQENKSSIFNVSISILR